MEVFIFGIGKVDIISNKYIVSHNQDLFLLKLLFLILYSINLEQGKYLYILLYLFIYNNNNNH
jgi:hypothetical protein